MTTMDYAAFLNELDEKLDSKLAEQRVQIVAEIDRKIANDHSLIVAEITKELNKKVTSLEDREKVLEEDHTSITSAFEDLQEQNNGLKTEIMLLKSDMEVVNDNNMKNEQYARKNNIKIYGIKDNCGEDCEDIVRKMVKEYLKIEIKQGQIAIAHRILGKQGRHRPIIVRFEQHDVKYAVLKQRRQLKGTGVSIQEDLARAVWEKLDMVKESAGSTDARAWNGKIFIKDKFDKIHKFTYGTRIPDPFRY